MKRLIAIILSLVMVLGLIGCKAQNNNDNNSKNSTVKIDTNDWKDYKFIINGAEIEFGKTKPSDVSSKLGDFTQNEDGTIPFSKEYEPKAASIGHFSSLYGKCSYSGFNFINISEDTVQAQDCVICDIDLEREEIENLGDMEIILPGNLDFETCKIDDLIKVYGEATNIFDNGEYIEGTLRYDWYEVDKGALSVLVNEDGFLLELHYDLNDVKYN